jgi:hypothetical protein
MEKIDELEIWMLNNNINDIYLPRNKRNKYVTDIGEGLEDIHGLYVWYYNDERGNRTDLKYFKSEKDGVQFVLEYLMNNEK